MNNYIIFFKDKESKVIAADLVTREISRELKIKGFAKYPEIIEANNEKDAIKKLNKQGNEHLNALSEYSGNIFFYCAVLVVGLVLAFIFSS
ncbi:hypothetical protein [Serratia inhibens]|uniref:hypothetical protein n=1 Tax=Serratia inhibens TaxID=2338073 RepID=UPI00080968A9|nr:hypothetical protein [Serratia inhibens]ANS40914.1 hypothetical protein Q5A_002085 [Serratia inhibens PRI-2C]